jgi:hypothetical protein
MPAFTLTAWIAVAGVLFCSLVLPPRDADGAPWTRLVPRTVLDAVVVLAGVALVVSFVVPWLLGAAVGPAEAGAVATIRTVALAAAVLLAAAASRTTRLSEMRWLVHPLLVLIGIKLLVDDFPRSAASTLFLALAAYGATLIVAPRLLGPGGARLRSVEVQDTP